LDPLSPGSFYEMLHFYREKLTNKELLIFEVCSIYTPHVENPELRGGYNIQFIFLNHHAGHTSEFCYLWHKVTLFTIYVNDNDGYPSFFPFEKKEKEKDKEKKKEKEKSKDSNSKKSNSNDDKTATDANKGPSKQGPFAEIDNHHYGVICTSQCQQLSQDPNVSW